MAAEFVSVNRSDLHLRWAIFALYVLFTLVGVLNHEHFRDETDTWGMVRDANLSQAWAYFSLSGHPPLWHALQWPFARLLQWPVATLGLLQAATASAVAALLLFAVPIPLYLSAAYFISIGGFYQYAVIARGYATAFAMLFAVVALHRHRFRRPYAYTAAIALLSATEVHMWGAVAGLSVLWLHDLRQSDALSPRTKRIAVAGLLLFGACIVRLMWPRADANPNVAWHLPEANMLWILQFTFFPVDLFEYAWPDFNQDNYFYFLIINLALFVTLFFYLGRCGRRTIGITGAALTWYAIVIFGRYFGGYHHLGLLPVLLLFGVAFAYADGAALGYRLRAAYALTLALAASAPLGWAAWRTDYALPYSGAKAAAEFLRPYADPTQPIIALGCTRMDAVASYLPPRTVMFVTKKYNPQSPKSDYHLEAFHNWNKEHNYKECFAFGTVDEFREQTVAEVEQALRVFPERDGFILLSPVPLPTTTSRYQLTPLHVAHAIFEGDLDALNTYVSENYHIYRLQRR